MVEMLLGVGTFVIVVAVGLICAWGLVDQKTVHWVGGPFDGQRFTVPRSKQSVRVGMTWLDGDVDNQEMLLVERRMAEWPIERHFWRHYVVWRDG